MSREVARFDRMIDELRDVVLQATAPGEGEGMDGYSVSADAMWKAALAAFNGVADIVGATGFQASWAALRFYGKVMRIESPFMVLKLEDAVYPQYDLPRRIHEWIDENRGWLAKQAQKNLDEYEAAPTLTFTDDDGVEQTAPRVASSVVAHWRSLVSAGSS